MKKKKKMDHAKYLAEHDKHMRQLVSDMMDLTVSLKGIIPKSYLDELNSVVTDIVEEDPTFIKMLADPKADIAKFEPIIKNMLKRKKKK